jgi:hypothetical protein
LPILAAIFGVGISSVFVVLVSHVITVPSFAPYIALTQGGPCSECGHPAGWVVFEVSPERQPHIMGDQ